MISKAQQLEWLKRRSLETVFTDDSLNTIRRVVYGEMISALESGTFDIHTNVDVKEIEEALDGMKRDDFEKRIHFEAKVRRNGPEWLRELLEALGKWNNLRPEVQWFAKQMELKLQENDHKSHWSKCHTDYLIDRLYQEAGELYRAIRNGEPPENVIKEAADVANFAMMIADNAPQSIKGAP